MKLAGSALGGVILILAAGGCRLGPEFKRPAVNTPPQWRWKTAEPKDHVPRGEWWKVFGDPALARLEAEAAQGNYDLKAALARVEQARAAARMSRAELWPGLTGQGTWTRYRTSGNSPSPVPFPVPSFTQAQWAIPFDLSYELDLWGRVRRSFESARHLALGAESARQLLRLSLEAELAATYFTVQALEVEIGFLTRAIDLRRQALEIFKQRLEAGVGNEFEVQRAQVEVATAEADLKRAERQRAQAINGLALFCGKSVSDFSFEIAPGQNRLPAVAPDLPSSLLERRPDVAEAERDLAARLARIGVAQAAFFPSVHLTARGGVLSGDVTDLFLWDSRTWSIGPSVTLPLFQGGRNKAALAQARAAYDEGLARYRQRVLTAFKEVEDSLAALQFLQGEAEARAHAADAAAQAAKLSLERYRAGSVNFLEVIDSENSRLMNELARARIAGEQRVMTVRLIKALGGGWE